MLPTCVLPASKMSLHEACRKHFSRNVNNMKRLTKLLRMHSRNPVRSAIECLARFVA